MKWGAWIFLLAMVGGASGGEKREPVAPTPEKVGRYGCAIALRESTKNIAGGWYLTVWVNYKDRPVPAAAQHHWEALYSIRERRIDALEDCNRWLDELEKSMERVRHRDAKTQSRDRKQ